MFHVTHMTKEEKKMALAYIKHRFPVGSVVGLTYSTSPHFITKYTVYEVDIYDDEQDERYKEFMFFVRDRGKKTQSYHFHNHPKSWVQAWVNKFKLCV